MKPIGKTAVIIVLTLVAGTSVLGDQSDFNYRRRGDQQWKLSFGIGENHTIPRGTHVPHLEFNVATGEFEKFISPRTAIGYELSLAGQTNNGDNDGISVFLNHTRYFFVHGRFSADYKLGLGVMQLHDIVRGQATKSNFNEQLGVGIQYATSANSAITLGYTLYHASNAGMERPNHGINATIFAVGLTYYR